MTTAEKVQAAIDELRQTPPEEMPADVRELIAGVQMLAGFGVDPFSLILPADPADADVMLDKTLALLLQLRGDDLPPFRLLDEAGRCWELTYRGPAAEVAP